MESQIEREIRRKEKLITRLSHGQRPTKLNGRKRKGVDEYAAEYEADFTTSSIEQDGEFVQFLVCRYCTSQIIGARSDRIKEHLTSQRHQKNKWGNYKPPDTDTQPQTQTQNGSVATEISRTPQYSEEKKIAIEKLPKSKHKYADPEKGAGKVNRKTVGEYAKEYSSDLTTSTVERDGDAVDILICRYCNCPIGPRSDRIKEHLISKRHQNNKSRPEVVQSLPTQLATTVVPADIPELPLAIKSEMHDSTGTTLPDPHSEIKKVRRFANVKLVDVGKMIHECKLCGRLVPTSDASQTDQKIFLNNYKCSRCNFEGNSVDEYQVHMSLHDLLQPCNCQGTNNSTNGNNGCGQTFANKSNSSVITKAMKQHMVGRKSGAQPVQFSHPSPPVTTITNPSTEYNYNYNMNTMEILQNNIPMSNPYPSPTQGMRLLENFYELTAGEIKSENYITLQLDFSEY